MRRIMSLVFALASVSAGAQEYERVLIPVATNNFYGAHGSYWTTSLTIFNGLDRPLVQGTDLGPLGDCISASCDELPDVPPGTAFNPILQRPFLGWKPGLLLLMRRDVADNLHFSLRVQDLSRQAQTWGTEIPVIRERDLRTSSIVFPNVPTEDRFRQSLRVYMVDPPPVPDCQRAAVRVLNQTTGATLFQTVVELTAPNGVVARPTNFQTTHTPQRSINLLHR